MDYNVVSESDSILNETFFYIEEYDRYIELKYPEKKDFCSEEQFNVFFNELKEYIKLLIDKFKSSDMNFIFEEVNIGSLIDFAIIDQFMGEIDHTSRSFNMFFTTTSINEQENNKISFSHILDYDMCFVTPWTNSPNEYYYLDCDLHFTNIFFQTIANNSSLYDLLKTRYKNYASSLIDKVSNEIYIFEDSIKQSLYLNSVRWYEKKYQITLDNIIFMNKYLLNRKLVLDKFWIN